MGLARRVESAALDWLPTANGFASVNRALRELLGLLVRA
jgi:hypothetical protein